MDRLEILQKLNMSGASAERIVRFACDCALLNVELLKPHTDKYEDIVKFLHNPEHRDSDYMMQYSSDAAYYASFKGINIYHSAWSIAAAGFASNQHVARVPLEAYYAADEASKVSPESKEKVNKLLTELINEVKEFSE